jgi:hypothetical protein
MFAKLLLFGKWKLFFMKIFFLENYCYYSGQNYCYYSKTKHSKWMDEQQCNQFLLLWRKLSNFVTGRAGRFYSLIMLYHPLHVAYVCTCKVYLAIMHR